MIEIFFYNSDNTCQFYKTFFLLAVVEAIQARVFSFRLVYFFQWDIASVNNEEGYIILTTGVNRTKLFFLIIDVAAK
jgi:hypothetical protein